MDRFAEFGFYCDVVSAMESMDADLDGISSSAMEAETIRKTNKVKNKAGAKIIAKIRTAAKNNDKEACLAAIEELEQFIKDWKNELRAMPKDKSETIRAIIKAITTILAVLIIFKGKAVHDLILKVAGKIVIKAGVTMTTMAVGKFAGEFASFFAQYVSWGKIFTGIFTFLVRAAAPNNPEYANDPNAKNVLYRNTLASLDMVIGEISSLKNDIKSGTDIKYALTKAGL